MLYHTRASLLALLEENDIKSQTHEHPTVMTVEEQVKYVGHLEGGHSKNLLLKDKKNRLFLISALTTTKVDLKVLSQRLGLGKGGLRMAPEDNVQSALQVPLGCVTPFALINECAGSVTLLLDKGFQSKSQLFFHPLSNDATTALSPSGLDKFLSYIGRQAIYVDLEAVVLVGKDQSPDLACYAPSVRFLEEEIASTRNTTLLPKADQNVSKSGAPKSKGKLNMVPREKEAVETSAADVQRLVTSILKEITSAVGSEDLVCGEGHKETGKQLHHLSSELESILITFKNICYTEGFAAGLASQVRHR